MNKAKYKGKSIPRERAREKERYCLCVGDLIFSILRICNSEQIERKVPNEKGVGNRGQSVQHANG